MRNGVQKVTIAKIATKQIETKYGPKTKLGILITEEPNVWISGFENKDTKNWREGMTVEVDITIDPKYGPQFKMIDPVVALEKRVKALEDMLLGKAGVPTKEDFGDVDTSSIPF